MVPLYETVLLLDKVLDEVLLRVRDRDSDAVGPSREADDVPDCVVEDDTVSEDENDGLSEIVGDGDSVGSGELDVVRERDALCSLESDVVIVDDVLVVCVTDLVTLASSESDGEFVVEAVTLMLLVSEGVEVRVGVMVPPDRDSDVVTSFERVTESLIESDVVMLRVRDLEGDVESVGDADNV